MSSSPTRFNPAATYAAFLAQNSDLLQVKVNPRGSDLDEIDSNTSAIAAWPNLVDDFMMAIAAGTHDVYLDSRASPTVTGSATSGGGTVNFTVALPKDIATVRWLRVLSNASSVGGRVQFWRDSARTVLIYDSLLQLGNPPVDVADFYDGSPWSTLSATGVALEASSLYGRITNSGGSNSTYNVYMYVRA